MDNPTQGNFEVVHDDPEVIPPLPSEDRIHAFVHHHRVQLVKEMMEDGKMPTETKDRVVLLAALKDMDSSALSRKRLAVDANNGEITAGATAIIAKLLTSMPNNSRRDLTPVEGREAPKLGPEFPEPDLLEGETAVTLPQQSYDTFMSKFPRPGETK